jgi:hypothetical protein
VQKKAPPKKSPPKKPGKKKSNANAESKIVASALDEANSNMMQQ